MRNNVVTTQDKFSVLFLIACGALVGACGSNDPQPAPTVKFGSTSSYEAKQVAVDDGTGTTGSATIHARPGPGAAPVPH